jgi:hypothetical protein
MSDGWSWLHCSTNARGYYYFLMKMSTSQLGTMVYTCNPSYSGG